MSASSVVMYDLDRSVALRNRRHRPESVMRSSPARFTFVVADSGIDL